MASIPKLFILKGGKYFNLHLFTRAFSYIHSQFALRVKIHISKRQNGLTMTGTTWGIYHPSARMVYLVCPCGGYGWSLIHASINSQKEKKHEEKASRCLYGKTHFFSSGVSNSSFNPHYSHPADGMRRSPWRLDGRTGRLLRHMPSLVHLIFHLRCDAHMQEGPGKYLWSDWSLRFPLYLYNLDACRVEQQKYKNIGTHTAM